MLEEVNVEEQIGVASLAPSHGLCHAFDPAGRRQTVARLLGDDQAGRHKTGFEKGKSPH